MTNRSTHGSGSVSMVAGRRSGCVGAVLSWDCCGLEWAGGGAVASVLGTVITSVDGGEDAGMVTDGTDSGG